MLPAPLCHLRSFLKYLLRTLVYTRVRVTPVAVYTSYKTFNTKAYYVNAPTVAMDHNS